MKIIRSRSFRFASVALAVAAVTLMAVAGSAMAGAKIQFVKPKYDFGSVGQGLKVNLAFPFKNVGDSELTIGDIHTSCGCTNASASSTKVAPGKTAQIKAVFNTGGYKGKVMKTITVETNDPDNKSVQLIVTGVVKAGVEVFPTSINFGTLKRGKAFNQTLVIKPLDPANFSVTSIDCNAGYISVSKPRKHPSIKGAWEAQVSIKGDGAPSGKVFDSIQVRTNLQGTPVVGVRVLGTVQAD